MHVHIRLLFVHAKIARNRLLTLCHGARLKDHNYYGGVQSGACVLIVDDHAIIRRMLHALFEANDLEVCEAENGAEGVQKAQDLNPGLVILDLSMPVMNGLEAARALQLTMPHVPLLMFTNNTGAAMEKEARRAGIFAVVSKSDANSSQQLMAHAKPLLGLDGAQVRYVS